MAHGLTIENVCWGPSSDRPIIEDVSFEVAPGTVTAIVGANGAGKSSLLRCVYRMNRPQAGRVLLDGGDIWSMRPPDVAGRVAAVLQESASDFPFTVREVVAMGRTPHLKGVFSAPAFADEAVVERMLDRLELCELAGQPFSIVSGGERQRALLARALVQEPGLLVLDEPTNHLDIRHQLEILRELRKLKLTIVTSLHDLTLAAAIADQVVVMKAGRVEAAGPPHAVLTPEIILAAFQVDATVAWRGDAMRFDFSLPGTVSS